MAHLQHLRRQGLQLVSLERRNRGLISVTTIMLQEREHMRKSLAALLATLLMSFAVVLGSTSPASADEEDCPESNIYGYVCLWKWENFTGGRYQGKLNDIAAIDATSTKPEGCWNLSNSTFGSPHLGDPVNNESASLVVEPSVYPWKIQFFDWVNCNMSSYLFERNVENTYTAIARLGYAPNGTAYHRITSFRVIPY